MKLLVECDTCNATVQADSVGSYVKNFEPDWMLNISITLCKCPKCFSPILIEQELEFPPFEGDLDWGQPKKILPTGQFHINPVIPDSLRKILVEAIKCYKVGAVSASVLMSRKTSSRLYNCDSRFHLLV